MRDNRYYLAAIDLADRPCVVVGAGPVGLEKVTGLLAADADVTVVALQASDEILELAQEGRIRLHLRPYEETDLDGASLVIAATSDRDLNERIHADAIERSLLVNVADVPDLCNFILPAIVRDGPIAVAISTAGASPALAQRMKREAAALFDRAYAELAGLLEEQRPWAKRTLPTYQDRKAFFDSIVNAEPDPIELLRAGDHEAVRAQIHKSRSSFS